MMQEQAVPNEGLPNLICMVPGPDPGAIVVGTRLESNAKGDEAEVDWGGPILLPLLAESMISAPHHQTMIFVAFAGHDHGLAGANYFLSHLNDEQRAQSQAMIQIDKIGRASCAVWLSRTRHCSNGHHWKNGRFAMEPRSCAYNFEQGVAAGSRQPETRGCADAEQRHSSDRGTGL